MPHKPLPPLLPRAPESPVASPSAARFVSNGGLVASGPNDTKPGRIQAVVPADLHTRFKIECLRQKTDMSTVVEGLVRGWLDGTERPS